MFTIFGGLLIWLLFTILVLPVLLSLGIFKLIVTIYHTKFKRSVPVAKGEIRDVLFSLSAIDSIFPSDSSWVKPVMNLGLVLKLEGPVFPVDPLRRHFYQCFLDKNSEGGRYDKLSSYLVALNGCAFRALVEDINLEELIYEVTLERDECIETFLAKWMTLGYRERKPCWEMILVKGPAEPVLAFKIHHGLCDGYSLVHILDKLCGNTSPYLVKGFKEGPLFQLRQLIKAPAHLGRYLGLMTTAQRERNRPFWVKLNPGQHENLVSFTSFPLDQLKEIRRKWGVHMSSVLITILTGALRQFLEENGRELPDNISFVQTLPWPNHSSRKSSSFPNRDRLCNEALITASPNTPLAERDPLTRLHLIESELKAMLEPGLDTVLRRIIVPLIGAITLTSVVRRNLVGSRLSVAGFLTFVVGGDHYNLLGSEVKNIHPFLVLHDSILNSFCPLNCFAFSHSGMLDMTFTAHASVFKDQTTLDRILKEYAPREMELLSASRDCHEKNRTQG